MIRRLLTTALLGTALLVAGPATDASLAKDKPAKTALKQCKIKGANNKMLTWKCKSDQPCCYNASTNQGVCGSTVIGCF